MKVQKHSENTDKPGTFTPHEANMNLFSHIYVCGRWERTVG